MKGKLINVSVKRFAAFTLAFALIFGCIFTVTPTAFATSAEEPEVSTTPELRKGSLFLKANVPDDFYDVVCVTLKDKASEKELTLKVEGGTVFEVYIKLPDGEYEVVSAYVEKSDQYTVTFDQEEITAGADLSPSILLDVQPKLETEEDDSTPDPISSEAPSDTTEQGDKASAFTDPGQTASPEETDSAEAEDSTTNLSDTEKSEDDENESSSNKTKETIWDICLSILAAVVFFALISLIVFLVRNKMEEE